MVTFDKTQSCNTDTHCLASLLDELYVKWPFKVKKELTPPLPIMMDINIDNETCHLALLSGPIKKSILCFPVHDGQNVLFVFETKRSGSLPLCARSFRRKREHFPGFSF